MPKKDKAIKIDHVEPARLYDSAKKNEKSGLDFEGIKHHFSENKSKYIGAACVIVALGYVGLGPMGGYNSLKQKWTKPLEQKVKIAENEKGRYAELYSKSTDTIEGLIQSNEAKDSEVKRLKEAEKSWKSQLDKNNNYKLQAMISEAYNPNCFYDAQINAAENALEMQTAAINTDAPVTEKYNLTFCGARFILNEDLKEILGSRWKPYSEAFVNGNIDIELDLPKYGKEIKLVNWETYDTIFEPKGSISLTDSDLKSIKRMMNKYRDEK